MPSKQLTTFALLLALYIAAAVVYALIPGGMAAAQALSPAAVPPDIPMWQLALANAGLILVAYGALGLAGLYLARRAGLPGIYRPEGGRGSWLTGPLAWGVAVGVVLVALDWAARSAGYQAFVHPPFPASLLASLTAGIGEEILFRLFVMSLWVSVLRWLLAGRQTSPLVLWLANGLAALAFSAGHLGTAMVLSGAATPAQLPPVMLAEILVLNGGLGLVAGRAFARDGLVAAAGIHFWADVVWHVIYGLLG
ncbi:MAG: CPBP family intramembrane metalloprotease [Chloroflexi bacterium]|nr:CPBP family intramembrane metalloprotease [Chloroflexota bacterium]